MTDKEMGCHLYLGVDVGASAAKALVLDADRSVLGMGMVLSGVNFSDAGNAAVERALAEAGGCRSQIAFAVSTGYGRKNVAIAHSTKTEISCHGRGAYHYFPEIATVIDIGGQDNKVIRLGSEGSLLDFSMNRKCAAGTGAFLEEIARRIDIDISEMEELAQQSTIEVEIGSFCTVFSLTEVLAMIRRGTSVPDITKAAFRSVAKRVAEMSVFSGYIAATGGVIAHNPTIVTLLSKLIGSPILIPPAAQFTGAMGAALYAIEESTGAR